jgi:hypothetical protein
VNLVADPDRFLGSLLAGLQNGMFYALVALGASTVYGVIALINFAHGPGPGREPTGGSRGAARPEPNRSGY